MDTQENIFGKLRAAVPKAWFGDDSPILDAVLNGIAWAMGFCYDTIQQASLQLRITTATGGFLDMIAGDFFGSSLMRKSGESDATFRARILVYMFRERATRAGLSQLLVSITGKTPRVFEFQRPMDTGGYRSGGVGYGVAGGYGSLLLPYQCMVDVYRPDTIGIPNVAGYGSPSSGYSTPSQGEYASMDMVEGYISDTEIYRAIEAVKPIGTTVWVRIQ